MRKIKEIMFEIRIRVVGWALKNQKKALVVFLVIPMLVIGLGIGATVVNVHRLNAGYDAKFKAFCVEKPEASAVEICEYMAEVVDPAQKHKCEGLSKKQIAQLKCGAILRQK